MGDHAGDPFVLEHGLGINLPHVYHLEGSRRCMDCVVAAVLLVGSLPLWPLIAIAICVESPGWPIHSDYRVGLGGVLFRMLKFRTMWTGSEPRACKDIQDDRVTRVGAFLRRTSLDEAPQLLNVLRGDMTLVGPRPETAVNLPSYRPGDFVRFAVRPGLTGLWQTSGRSLLRLEEKLDLDSQYVKTRCLLLDLRILARTPMVVVRGRGAY